MECYRPVLFADLNEQDTIRWTDHPVRPFRPTVYVGQVIDLDAHTGMVRVRLNDLSHITLVASLTGATGIDRLEKAA